MIVKGFRFGMLLQLAVGPVCVFIFNLASNRGFTEGIFAVIGVTLIDALYILLATVGISKLVDLKRHERLFTIIGASVILLFSLNIILGAACSIDIFPQLSGIAGNVNALSGFWQAVILTVSNPITILFWSGVFSVKIIEHKMGKTDVLFFGIGAALSTFVFLSLIVCLGMLFHSFLSETFTKLLNIIIAIILIHFSVTNLVKKRKRSDISL
ncbi:MAG: LysE family transporter [Clostridia bacterium]|nr:LysE family transporter [Clostridia bacterium]